MFRIGFMKKLFLSLILLSVYILLVYWNFFVKNLLDVKFKNYTKTNIITNIVARRAAHSPECYLEKLDHWDTKIKNLFKKLPVYTKCKKHRPFTYINNSSIYFDSSVNITHYQGLLF